MRVTLNRGLNDKFKTGGLCGLFPARRTLAGAGRPCGFSLVELLVVIGIIGVLIAILLPVISSVRRQAEQMKCSSNQRQIASAFLMHAHEHKGYFPLAGELAVFKTPGEDWMARSLLDGARKRYTYARWKQLAVFCIVPLPGALAPYLGIKNLNYGDVIDLDQQLNDRSGVWKMFMCPGTESFDFRRVGTTPDDTTPAGQGTLMTIYMNGSGLGSWSTNTDYAFNEGLLGFHNQTVYQSRRLAGNSAKLRNSSRVMLSCDALPGQLPAYLNFAHLDPWIVFTPSLYSSGAVTLADVFENTSKVEIRARFDLLRHRGKVVVAYADGHVEVLRATSPSLKSTYLLPP